MIRKSSGRMEILLIKDRFSRWTWPKGHIEPGETPECAALREINEETGLNTLRVETKLGEQQYCFFSGLNRVSKTVYVFLVEAKTGETLKIQPSEISDGAWFSEEDALNVIEYEGSRAILNEGIRKFKDSCY